MKKPAVADILHVPIAVILTSHPQASHVFIRNRMWCIGCAFSKFHTLKDVIEIYQLDEETLLGEVKDLFVSKHDLDPS